MAVTANLTNSQLIQHLHFHLRQHKRHSVLFFLQFFQKLFQVLNTGKINVIHTRKAQDQTPLIWIIVLFQEAANVLSDSRLERRSIGKKDWRIPSNHQHVWSSSGTWIHFDIAINGSLVARNIHLSQNGVIWLGALLNK